MPESVRTPWEQIEELLRQKNAERLREYLETLSSGEVARALSRLDDENKTAILTLLGPEPAAALIEALSDTLGADLIEDLAPEEAAAIIDEMESDHRADVLGELGAENAEAILERMHPEEALEIRQLLTYPEETAGGIMVTEFLAYPIHLRVSDVLDDMRKNAERYSDYSVQYAYVLSESGTLVGVIRLQDLILSKSETPLTSVMIPNPLYVYVDTSLDELNQFFDRYAFVGVPVTDHEGHLVGVVRRGDAEEAYSERAEETLMRFGGIIGGEEFRSMSVTSRSSRRLAWLVVNMLLSLTAASVILRFHGTIEAAESAVFLVFFLPVVANLSGCSGNQAVAVSIRELALGLIQPEDFLLVLWKEIQVGLFTGFLLGGALGAVAYLLGGNAFLSLVIGGALALNTLVALSIGALVPLFLKHFKLDPALAAPLVLTTITDMCGFLLLLGLATVFVTRHLL